MRLRAALLPAIAILAATLAAAGAAEPLKIRHGWVALTNTLSPMIFGKTDMMPHYGKSYVVEPMHFAGTTQEITAIATNEVDIITIAYSSLAIAVENAHLDDLRVIADGFQDGVGDYASSLYMVRDDGGIKTIADVKDKVLLVNSIGAAVDIAARARLKQNGLDAGKDYTVVEAEFPMMGAMLLQKKADIIADVPPFAYEPKLQAGSRVLFTMKDAMGPSQMIMLAARKGWLEQNRAALDDFFADLAAGLKWMLDPKHRDAAVKFASDASKIPLERLQPYYLTGKDYYRDPRGLPNVDALIRNIATQRELGLVKGELDVRKYVDLSYMERGARTQ
jgi:sulfonate transport system substrate-binding protein